MNVSNKNIQTTYVLMYQECVYSWYSTLDMMGKVQIQLIFCRYRFVTHLEGKKTCNNKD